MLCDIYNITGPILFFTLLLELIQQVHDLLSRVRKGHGSNENLFAKFSLVLTSL